MSYFKLTDFEIKALCEAGAAAPSGGNAQPWKVEIVNKNKMFVFIDKERAGNFLDVGFYASYLAVGAFFENLRITMDFLGLVGEINFGNCKNINKSIFSIHFINKSDKKKKDKGNFYKYIFKRTTNRKFYDSNHINENKILNLTKVITNFEGFNLNLVTDESVKVKIAKILGRGDVIRTLNNELFTEMFSELRWSRQEIESTKDGIDINSLELPGNEVKKYMLLKKIPKIRYLLPKSVLRDMAKPLLVGCSHLCCISMNGKPDTKKMFKLGRILQLIWLQSTKDKLAFHPWTILPFLIIRALFFNNKGLTKEDLKELTILNKELIKLFKIPSQNLPVFIFRLSIAPDPSILSLRRNFKSFTYFK